MIGWSQLVAAPWGRAVVATAVFLIWCVVCLALARLVWRWLNRASFHTPWEGFDILRERLRWVLPAWIGLSGLVVAVETARLFWEHGAVAALGKALLAVLVLSVGVALAELAFRLVGLELRRANTPEPLVKFTQAMALVVGSLLAVLFLLAVINVAITPLFALAGLALVPVVLVFQDTLANIASYMRLVRGQRLRVGDFVRLEDGVAGHVEEVTWQDVRIRTRANNLLAVPNRRFTRLLVTNYHLPEAMTHCSTSVLVTGAADAETVEEVLLDELQAAARELPGIAAEERVYVRRRPALEKDGLGFVLSYRVVDPDFREGVERELLQRVARRFHLEGVQSPLLDLVRSDERPEEPSTSAQELQTLVRERLGDTLFVVASNREPYIHNFDGASIRWTTPVSGLTSALSPVMSALGGVWVAHGSGSADREVSDEHGRLPVPPDSGRYTLRRLWLSKDQEDAYYYGFANQALWPLCHIAYVRPRFEANHWRAYREVNELFAQAIVEEVGGQRAFVFLQDYHLALVPRMLRDAGLAATVAHFWHIPWPTAEAFRTCPWAEELLEGLLGNDLMGFHVRQYCNNFLRSVDQTLESRVDFDGSTVARRGHQTLVRPFPIGVDFAAIAAGAASAPVQRLRLQFQRELGLGDCRVGLGVDRLDYTKGIPERLRALDLFFSQNPRYCGRFTFVQVGVPSRPHISEYKAVDDEVQHLVEEVNWRHQKGSWQPIVYLRRQFDSRSLWALYGLADVCIVSSLQDGMNLVAKEYVASRAGNDGVLVLSSFTGAAAELNDALQINPYDTEAFARAIQEALEMPPAEQRRGMQRLRARVEEGDIYRWAARVLSEFARLEAPTPLHRDTKGHGTVPLRSEDHAPGVSDARL